MASTTTNIGLTKPAGTDQALISAINGNMDIIDTKMGAVGNTSVQSQITSLSDQIAKSVIGDSAVDIPANSNLNDYATPGYFRCNSYATAQTITNVPLVCIFTLQVRYGSGTSYAVQEFTDIYTGKLWRRVKQGNTWTSWSSADDKIAKTKTKSFTMDCATALTQGASGYCGELAITSDIEGATFVIPQFARKSGFNYPLNVTYEGGALRLWSPASLTDVTVGVVLFFF